MTDTASAAEIRPVAVDDIFTASWGYDQTNVDYYKVVKVTAKTAWLVPIGKRTVEATGPMSAQVVPDPEVVLCTQCLRGEDSYEHQDGSYHRHDYVAPVPTLHRIQSGGYHSFSLKVRSWGVWAYRHKGGSDYESWYA